MITYNGRKYEELKLDWKDIAEIKVIDFIKKYNTEMILLCITEIEYDTDGENIDDLPEEMKIEFDLSDYDDDNDLTIQDVIDEECADQISDETGWLVEDFVINKVYK